MLGRVGPSWALMLPAVAAGLVGCEGRPNASPPPPELIPTVQLETPEDAARSALRCIQAELRAVAERNEPLAQACHDQLCTAVASSAVSPALRQTLRLRGLTDSEQVRQLADHWVAALNYYAEGFRLEQARRAGPPHAGEDRLTELGYAGRAGTLAEVLVPASGPDDDALIRLTCVREADGRWRIARIDFAGPSATTQQPAQASQPASP